MYNERYRDLRVIFFRFCIAYMYFYTSKLYCLEKIIKLTASGGK